MKTVELQKKLTEAARLQPPDERVPYGFERRVMALITERTEVARRIFWARGLWRAAVSCVALALLCGAISFFVKDSGDNSGDLSQDLETTLLASADLAEPQLP